MTELLGNPPWTSGHI